MTLVQKKLVEAYTTLVLAERKTIEEVPETVITLGDNSTSTIRDQVEIRVAERTVEILDK
jgi:hypothetical protein